MHEQKFSVLDFEESTNDETHDPSQNDTPLQNITGA